MSGAGHYKFQGPRPTWLSAYGGLVFDRCQSGRGFLSLASDMGSLGGVLPIHAHRFALVV